MGVETYERLFLLPLRQVAKAYRDAGARLASTTRTEKFYRCWTCGWGRGIDAVALIEYRCGMDAADIRSHCGEKLANSARRDSSHEQHKTNLIVYTITLVPLLTSTLVPPCQRRRWYTRPRVSVVGDYLIAGYV